MGETFSNTKFGFKNTISKRNRERIKNKEGMKWSVIPTLCKVLVYTIRWLMVNARMPLLKRSLEFFGDFVLYPRRQRIDVVHSKRYFIFEYFCVCRLLCSFLLQENDSRRVSDGDNDAVKEAVEYEKGREKEQELS